MPLALAYVTENALLALELCELFGYTGYLLPCLCHQIPGWSSSGLTSSTVHWVEYILLIEGK
jgi:hypothetical protein